MAVKTPPGSGAAEPDAFIELEDGSIAVAQVKALDRPRKRRRVRIGGTYVFGEIASAAQVRQAVADSSAMLDRLGHALSRPGVQLKVARDVPLYSADPENPDRLLRKLNGKVERGVLKDGAFKVLD